MDSRPAQIVYNGVLGGQIGIGAGGNAYCYDLTSHVLTQVLSGECTMIAYAAGRGFAFNINNGKTRLSNLNDLSTWDAGTFFQRGLFADPAQAMFADGNNLIWTIGTETFDVRYDSGQVEPGLRGLGFGARGCVWHREPVRIRPVRPR